MFYYADEFNLNWFPTLRAMWSPKGQQVMIPTPGQPDKYYRDRGGELSHGRKLRAVSPPQASPGGGTVVGSLGREHPTGTIYVAWNNADTHEDDEVEAVVRAAAGCLVLLYLPTYTVPGSIPSKCCGAIFAGKSLIASSLRRNRPYLQRHNSALSASINARRKSCRSLAPMPKKLLDCT